MSPSDDRHSKEQASPVLDVAGLPAATLEDVEALRKAARIPLGPARSARWVIALARSVSSETLRKRPNSVGEPFEL